MELQHFSALLAKGVNVSTAILLVAVWNGFRVSRVERAVAVLLEHHRACPQARKNRVAVPALLTLVFIAVSLLTGCVQTRFKVGNAEMERTALLVKVTVPNIEVGTNGTFRASVTSDARTELLEAVISALTRAAP